MPAISIIMPTARSMKAISEQPYLYFMTPTIKSLRAQSFTDFEFIIVDAMYDQRPKLFENNSFESEQLPFPVKHIRVHKAHRFWLDHKRWSVAASLNTGIIHANGELLVRIDDCSEFDKDYLKRIWDEYRKGYFLLAMHIRYLGGKPARVNDKYMEKGYEAKHSVSFEKGDRRELLERTYGKGGIVGDTRYPIVKKYGGRYVIPHVNWYYGYSSISLDAALKVNGYDENFDGDKSLEDVDFGSRLEMIGYKNFVLDVKHQVIEHEHEPIPADVIDRDVKPIKCNYALFILNRSRGTSRANETPFTDQDIKFIQEKSMRKPCSPTPDFYDEDCKGDLFNMWRNHFQSFDLREERMSII